MVEQACTEIATNGLELESYWLGLLVGVLIMLISWWFSFGYQLLVGQSSKKKLFAAVSELTRYNQGIVTVFDLVTKLEISPRRANKLLTKLAHELNIEPEIEESTGTKFYRFVDGDRIKHLSKEREPNYLP